MNSQPVTLYLPHPLSRATFIDPGSAIVATPSPDWQAGQPGPDPAPPDALMVVDYEGDRLGAHPTFADRAHGAHGRHTEHYPTSARCWLPLDQLRPIGTYDPVEGTITLAEDPDVPTALAAWLSLATDGDGDGYDAEALARELLTTSNARHRQRREIRQALRQPAQFPPQVVRWYARRYGHEDLLP